MIVRIVTRNGKNAQGMKFNGLICKVLAMNTPETLHGTIALTAAPASLRIRVKSTRFKPNLSNDGRNDCPGRIIAR